MPFADLNRNIGYKSVKVLLIADIYDEPSKKAIYPPDAFIKSLSIRERRSVV